jgi:hypothetical protein
LRLILLLIVPVATGVVATWASQPYRAAVITETIFNFPGCLYTGQTSWYGFPIPWFSVAHTLVFQGCELIDFWSSPYLDYAKVVEGAFLVDILIYMALYYALYYASIQAYIRMRRAMFKVQDQASL